VKILCPHGHRVADVTLDGGRWLIDIPRPDEYVTLLADGTAGTAARYPPREDLDVRPWRVLACPRECMLERSWYRVESADLERLAATGMNAHRIPHSAH
jgi:hypothetical protein